ncbi:alpha/beta hydrolase [Curvivirga aplysinae]|uniref:alpha/beta hydrolase n=1 Tax=Curvivirga aplysinae TaxID=2529852 RepID=UPI0012BB8F46|nr:alpha/beta hydrolase [Curvivirga aplysinae]MTI11040.1 alpha/beta hydrolase [Curvivirga aplysinae]
MSNQTSGIDWQDAFENGSYIENAHKYPDSWSQQSDAFRQSCANGKLDISYGQAEREKLDIFLPEDAPKGLVMFIHGGYWKAFDKSYWSFLAKGPVDRGYAVAMPSYTLAPDATLPHITQQICRALETTADLIEGPIFLAGHSAGGHLATRMICDDIDLPTHLIERIQRVISISGLHDLRPLRLHAMNDILGLDEDSCISESSALHKPIGKAEVIAWVGGKERPEFIRQSALISEAWGKTATNARLVVESTYHHFSVINGLKDSDSPFVNALLDHR